MNPNTTGALEGQVRDLTARVYQLEQALRAHGISLVPDPVPTPHVSPAPQNAPLPVQTLPQNPSPLPPPIALNPLVAPPLFAVQETADPKAGQSLENRIASQWFNRIGILALLIGMAWFLKLAIDYHWIGPLGRVLVGLISGVAIIAWSERFQHRGFPAFGYSLKAVGSGILYLSLWAAFSLYALIPASAAFAAMILVTAFNAFLAWIQDAELLALYAIAGGLSTPLLLSTGGNHEVTLLTYLLMLDLAVLVLAILRPWSRLLFAAFCGTAVFFAGWWAEFYSDPQLVRTAFFLTCFFLIFALTPRLVRVDLFDGRPASIWDNLALVLLPIGNAALAFLAYYLLFDSFSHAWAGAFLAVAFAAFYLLLIQLPDGGVLRPGSSLVNSLHVTLAIVFLTIAIPLKTKGRWLTIGWLSEGAAIFWLGVKQRSSMLRALALICLFLGLSALLTVNPPASAIPIFNARFGTYLFAIATFAFVAFIAWSSQARESTENLNGLTAACILIVNSLILIALSMEIHYYWWPAASFRSYAHNYSSNLIYAQLSYSALFMLFGAALLAVGFWQRSAFIRWQGLVLLAVAIGKVFLADISQLNQGFRILSFIGLGALLLAVSYVYQRDLLHLRDSARHSQ